MDTNKYTFRVVEQFISVNGEGQRAGQLALFIRFAGCNLNCEYCDTQWANETNVEYKEYTIEEICHIIAESGVNNVTLTGGEPLIQPGIDVLLRRLRREQTIRIEIETNGSVAIQPFLQEQSVDDFSDNVSFTVDYKTAVSGMEEKMHMENYVNLRSRDTVKFVVGSQEDLQKAKSIIESYHLVEKGCGIYLSPCFGKIEPAEMVDFLVEHRLNDVNIQLQLHKFIWAPDKRGV
ncbi:MAG: putative 7-carboxy-7-deazaguanine synthase QueE [Lachnospiraceae bacterium]|nr:putative 7-carboxy-7-deazaguanine synthase QueE [Lachnospiraceae bacterium]